MDELPKHVTIHKRSPSARQLVGLSVLAILCGFAGTLTSLYFLTARAFDGAQYSAGEIILPFAVGTVLCLVLQGITMWRSMR